MKCLEYGGPKVLFGRFGVGREEGKLFGELSIAYGQDGEVVVTGQWLAEREVKLQEVFLCLVELGITRTWTKRGNFLE